VFLEVAVESGLIGLACFLAMVGTTLGTILLSLTRSSRNGEPAAQWFRAGVLGALVANLVTYLFSFESSTTVGLFWSLAGMACAPVDWSRECRKSPKFELPGRWPERLRRCLGYAIASGGVALAAWMVVPDVTAFVGESLATRGLWRESTTVLGLASDLAPTPEVFLASQGKIYAMWAAKSSASDDAETIWQRGADVYARLVEQRSDVAEYWQARGTYLRRWNLTSRDTPEIGFFGRTPGSSASRNVHVDGSANATIAQQAIESYTEALRLSPGDPDLWLDRGLAWLDVGDLDRALTDFRQAATLLDGYTRYYGAMALYALAQGDTETAAVWQERALDAQQAWDAWAWRR
jgi:tetratricopeptide (TPR) repeat protein